MAEAPDYAFDTTVWESESFSRWAFVTVPPEISDEIDFRAGPQPTRGFGAVRVEVGMGRSTWRTSVFPDRGRGAYVLPMKKSVRAVEGVGIGDEVSLMLRLIDV